MHVCPCLLRTFEGHGMLRSTLSLLPVCRSKVRTHCQRLMSASTPLTQILILLCNDLQLSEEVQASAGIRRWIWGQVFPTHPHRGAAPQTATQCTVVCFTPGRRPSGPTWTPARPIRRDPAAPQQIPESKRHSVCVCVPLICSS